jgi:hypothetical protein
MKLGRISLLVLILGLGTGCGGGGGSSSSGGGGTPPSPKGDNVLLVTVNGSLCSNNSYLNKACVSVTVCTPGTTTCQTINDILLDTGSFGLRIFSQVLNVSFSPVGSGPGFLAECVQYADGSSDWGPIQMASVILGNEPAVQVPVQVIDSTFGTVPGQCGIPHQSPSEAGYNGILGVGFFAHDCGSGCAAGVNNGVYFSCNGKNCTGTAVPLDNQVQNPVALLPMDNNGIIVQLPSVSAGGAPSVDGSLVLGIGTQSNNVPSGVAAYTASQSGNINTTFNAASYQGFIDSGSNGLFFSASLLPNCPTPNSGWFCPSSTVTLSATNTGASGSPSGVVSFQIANLESLLNSSNNVFNDIGGSAPDPLFDWGLPFFFGRNIFVGLEGRGSTLGTGPYWGY